MILFGTSKAEKRLIEMQYQLINYGRILKNKKEQK